MINLGALFGVRIDRYERADAEFADLLAKAHRQTDRQLKAQMARHAVRLRVEAVYPPGGRYAEEDLAEARRLEQQLIVRAKQQGIDFNGVEM